MVPFILGGGTTTGGSAGGYRTGATQPVRVIAKQHKSLFKLSFPI